MKGLKDFKIGEAITAGTFFEFKKEEAIFHTKNYPCPYCESFGDTFTVPSALKQAEAKTIFCAECLGILYKPIQYEKTGRTDSDIEFRQNPNFDPSKEETTLNCMYWLTHHCHDDEEGALILYKVLRESDDGEIYGHCYECDHCQAEQYLRRVPTKITPKE